MAEKTAEKPHAPLLTLDLGENGGVNEFFSIKEMYEWIDRECNVWVFVNDQSGPNKQRTDGLQNLREVKLEMDRRANQWSNSGDSTETVSTRLIEQFKSKIVEYYVTKRLYSHSRGRFGVFILDMKDQDQEQAMWLWWIWHRPGQISTDSSGVLRPQMLTAAFRGVEFLTGFKSSAAEKKAMKSLQAEWRKILGDEHRVFQEQRDLATALARESAEHIANLKSQMAEAAKEHEEMVQGHADEMESIQKKFQDELAVRSAVEFWNSRAGHHRGKSNLWGKVALVYAAAAFILLPWLQYMMSGIPTEVKLLIKSGDIDAAGVSTLLTHSTVTSAIRFVVMAMIAAWPLRLFVRNYLSHSHLEADAMEREIVVRTYLALLNDPDLVGKEDLKEQILPHALQNIFRHTSDGIVKDDGIPWQSISEAFGKKSSSSGSGGIS
ncbi:DUF6161 domain-containing protein [Schlesneria paludicola]|uniref:DUF6161 domain-containing protein n=1 Tax=Schlesneria paludicola TaxID=360056 RepID=UPI00029A897A|nr:DUF6161 domain-containing protein [Schlesneria paludicola]